jgi:hypothetical protein
MFLDILKMIKCKYIHSRACTPQSSQIDLRALGVLILNTVKSLPSKLRPAE